MSRKIMSIVLAPSFVLTSLLLICLSINLFNIGYNSPSGDEAIYVKIGTDSIFNHQWGLYNTASWVGGHPYFYPSLTAIAYAINGIYGSRILNIVLLMIGIYFVAKLTYLLSKSVNSTIISVVLVGFSSTSLYIGRLATYDMPSFTLLIIGIYLLTKAVKNNKTDHAARNFLISALTLVLSFAFKYISILYIICAATVSYLYIKGLSRKLLLKTWIFYFAVPLGIFLLVAVIMQFKYLGGYLSLQLMRDKSTIWPILSLFFQNIISIIPFFITGVVGLSLNKKSKFAIASLFFSISILVFHILSLRYAALDKHLFLVILPLALCASIGIPKFTNGKVAKIILVISLVVYVLFNIFDAQKYNHLWPDHRSAQKFLSLNLNENDNLLTEEESSLLTKAKVTTFDWFTYNGSVGEDAYLKALDDGYFKFVELSLNSTDKTRPYRILEEKVLEKLSGSYFQIYKDNYYTIYLRGY